jgi:hypothetical protein
MQWHRQGNYMTSLITDGHFPLYACAFFLALVAVLVVSALCVALRAASLWMRFEKACGGHASAMNVLTAAEQLVDDVTDTGISRDMRSAWRRGLLKDGDL